MCTISGWYRACACIFNSGRICAQFLYSDLLDYFWMKDARGLIGEYNSVETCFGDDSDLPWSLDGVWPTEEGVVYWGFFDSVLLTRELPSIGNIYLLLSHDSLRIDVDSTLERGGGGLPNSTGEILLRNSWGSYFCALDLRGSPSMILDLVGFSWWSRLMEDFSWYFLIHWGMFWCFQSTWDIFDGSDPLGMLFYGIYTPCILRAFLSFLGVFLNFLLHF